MNVRCYFINEKIPSELLTEATMDDHSICGTDKNGNKSHVPWTALAAAVEEKV